LLHNQYEQLLREEKKGAEMKKWLPAVHRLASSNTVRLIWVLLAIAALVLGSGAPECFGGGSGGGG